jgi:hypothetical protein
VPRPAAKIIACFMRAKLAKLFHLSSSVADLFHIKEENKGF